jgi:hypothetical protein
MSANKTTAEKELKNIGKKSKLPLIVGLLILLGVVGFGSWYLLSTPQTATPAEPGVETVAAGNPQTPTEAYKKIYAAVKNKNTNEIKSLMTKDSIGLAQMQAGQSKKKIEDVLANAFTSTTFADQLPPIRDERVKGKFGAIEVYDYSKKQWQDLPFIIEDGSWKLAVGNLFAGTFESPGKGRATIERENANAAGNTKMVPYGNGNVNTNVEPKIIDPLKGGKVPPAMQKGKPPVNPTK